MPFQTLTLHSHIDAVSINEGVYTLHDLCKLESPGFDLNLLRKVRGLVFRNQDSNTVNSGLPGEIVPQSRMELDLPGYAWDLLPYNNSPLDLYRSHLWHCDYDTSKSAPFAAIYTSFGCIFSCSFCMINIINKSLVNETTSSSSLNTMRFVPLSVLEELDFFAMHGITNVRICDKCSF